MQMPGADSWWYDLMTNDPKKAEAFYQKVAGWGTQVWDRRIAVHDVDRERKPNRRRVEMPKGG